MSQAFSLAHCENRDYKTKNSDATAADINMTAPTAVAVSSSLDIAVFSLTVSQTSIAMSTPTGTSPTASCWAAKMSAVTLVMASSTIIIRPSTAKPDCDNWFLGLSGAVT